MDSECIWKDKIKCNESICDDCDWKELPFEKQAILNRITKEKRNLRWLYIMTRKRKEKEIQDKANGIYLMYDILEKHFGITNEINKEIKELVKT